VKIGPTVDEEFEKVGFQHKSKWRTGSSAYSGIFGIYVVGLSQGIF